MSDSSDSKKKLEVPDWYLERYPTLIGCKGWLRALWVWLVIGIPLINLYMIIQELAQAEEVGGMIEGYGVFVILEIFIVGIMCFWSLFTGLKLSKVFTLDAIKSVKKFIKAWLGAQVLIIILLMIFIDAYNKDEMLGSMLSKLLLQCILYLGIV
ncbi:MAG: hypothetical protein PHT54_03800, partial [Candidatus Nanoarchaeia archaeon]|nr:hypothetical protein [Candidatus Nanoarchaeia archaeon]